MISIEEALRLTKERAIGFLVNHQHKDGGWPPDKPTDPTSSNWTTGHVLCALSQVETEVDPEVIKNGFTFLAKGQRYGGGWASEFHPENEVFPTSVAIIAFNSFNPLSHKKIIEKGITRLRKLQNADGGFGITDDDKSRVRASTFSLIALLRSYENNFMRDEINSMITGGLTWLIKSQNGNGGWGEIPQDDKSNVTCTAKALLTLTIASKNGFSVEREIFERGIRWICEHQLSSGAWEGWDERYTDNPALQDLYIEGLDTVIVTVALSEVICMLCQEECKEEKKILCSKLLESLFRGVLRLVKMQAKDGGWVLEKDILKPERSGVSRVWATPYLLMAMVRSIVALNSICTEAKSLLARILPEEVQISLPEVRLSIRRVGVTGVQERVKIIENGQTFDTVGNFDIYIDLIPVQKGIHMSRNIRALRKILEENIVTPKRDIESLCVEIGKECLRMQGKSASVAEIHVNLNMPFVKETPISGESSCEVFKVIASATVTHEVARKMVGVEVIGITACPSGASSLREINKARLKQKLGLPDGEADNILSTILGATHVQRARATLMIEVPERYDVAIEDLIQMIEESLGSATYGLLRRKDEASVIVHSHENLRFVEDCVRILAEKTVEKFHGYTGLTSTIRVITEESIHKHNAVAELRDMTLDRLKTEIERWKGVTIEDYYE